MATISQGPNSERAKLAPVKNGRKTRPNPSNSLAMKLAAGLVVLVVLGLAFKYSFPGSKHAQVQAAPSAPPATAADLQVSDVQMTHGRVFEVILVDGVMTNAGSTPITGAIAELDFRDLQGKVIASMQQSVGGIPPGGGFIQNQFKGNPLQPKEIRFFRLRVEKTPPDWNLELPELKIVEVKAR